MLTTEQFRQLGPCRRDWQNIVMSTAPVQRSEAERVLRSAYTSAGLGEPAKIIWCDGPAASQDSFRAHEADNIGQSVKDLIFDDPQIVATNLIRAQIGYTAEAVVAAGMRPPVMDPIGEVMGQGWSHGRAGSATPFRRRASRMRNYFFSLRRLPAPRRLGFWQDSFGHRDYAWLGQFEFARSVLRLEHETHDVRSILALARVAGWVLPYENVCWMCDRPTTLRLDVDGRLHSAAGPALAFADGSRWYAWKGMAMPAWVIERSHEITAQLIESQADPVFRRCLIEIVTPERYIALSNAVCISEDRAGKLWIRPWRASGSDGWAAVEVVNGTPEPDGSYKHYFLQVPFELRTAQAAVAWTYGLSESQYEALAFRT